MRKYNFVSQFLLILALCGLFQGTQAQTYPSFPYVANFGSSESVGADNSLYSFTSVEVEGGTEDNAYAWSFESNSSGRLFPTFSSTNSALETRPTMLTRPFSFRKEGVYKLKITYNSTIAFSDIKVLVRLAPLKAGGKYSVSFEETEVDATAPGNILLALNTSGIVMGAQTNEYDINVPSEGVYAVSIAIYPKGIVFESEGNIAIEGIEVSETGGIDASVGKIVSPISSRSEIAQKVSFWLENKGTTEIQQVKAYYKIGLQAAVSQVFNINIPASKAALLTFPTDQNLVEDVYKIQIYIDRLSTDVNGSNDTALKYISIYDKPYTIPFVFDFGDALENIRWNVIDSQKQPDKSWQFKYSVDNSKAWVEAYTNKEKNDGWLESPRMQVDSGRTYKISFSYAAKSEKINEKMGLYVSSQETPNWYKSELIWKNEIIDKTAEEKVIIYHTPSKSGDFYCAWRAYSANYSNGIILKDLQIDTINLLDMDFCYDFDPIKENISAQKQLDQYAYFMDENTDGQSWSVNLVPDEKVSYNSYYSAKASGKKGARASDWMVFRPVYLEAGTAYNLSYTRKAFSDGKNVELEIYIQHNTPPYSNEILEGSAFWKDTVKSQTFQNKKHTFTPKESGVYLMSFKYATNISDKFEVVAQDYNLYLDNIQLYVEERTSVQALYATVPVEAQMGGKRVLLSCTYKNYNKTPTTTGVSFHYSIDNAAPVSEEAESEIKAHQLSTYTFSTPANFSQNKQYTVRFWITKTASTEAVDTVTVTFNGLLTYTPPYWDVFTDTTYNRWSYASSAGLSSLWRIQKNSEAYSQQYAASCTAEPSPMNDYIVMPAMQLNKDTTYLISFYSKWKDKKSTEDPLKVCFSQKGKSAIDFVGNDIASVNGLSEVYKQYKIYYKPNESGPTFLAFHSTLPAFGGELWIDNILVIDSLSATKTAIELSEIQYNRVSPCDKEKTTDVKVKIRNMGFLLVDSVKIAYSIDKGEVKRYTSKIAMQPESEITVSLPEKWNLEESGKHSVVVFSDMLTEKDRSNDTLRAEYATGIINSLPFSLDFEGGIVEGTINDENIDGSTWQVVNNSADAHSGSCFLKYSSSGREALDGFTISCFAALSQEYTIDFYAKTAKNSSEERLRIYLVDYGNEGVTTMIADTVINNSAYSLFQIPFKISVAGSYSIKIEANSMPDGKEIYLDDILVSEYGLRDIALTQLVSPVQEDYYENASTVQVKIRNNGRVSEKNIPISIFVQGSLLESGTIDFIGGREERLYSFSHTIDMRAAGSYNIEVRLGWSADGNRSNDTLKTTFTQKETTDIKLVKLVSPLVQQGRAYTQNEKIGISVENCSRKDLVNIPLTVYVNDIKLQGTISTLGAGLSSTYKFEQAVDMSDSAWYNIVAFASVANDINRSNDTLRVSLDGRYMESGVEDNLQRDKHRLSVYPNPVESSLWFNIPQGAQRYEIYSMQGMLLIGRNVSLVGLTEENVSNLPQGIYILRVLGKGSVLQAKFIKK